MYSNASPAHEVKGLAPLRDGAGHRIRPLRASDRDLLDEGFARLSPQSRRLRFFSAKSRLTAAELDHLTRPDGRDHIALAAFELSASGRETACLGVARCFRLEPQGEVAEMAVAVVDQAQGLGLGRRLVEHLAQAARAAGIRRFQFVVLADNLAMRRLAEALGAAARWLGDGTFEYDWPLPAAAPALDTDWLMLPGGLFNALFDGWLAVGTRMTEVGLVGYRDLLAAWFGEAPVDARQGRSF